MKSILKKSICLLFAFVFVFNVISINVLAASVSTSRYSVTVYDIGNNKTATVSAVINYQTAIGRDGKYFFMRASVDSNTDFKVKGLKKWKVSRVNDKDSSKTKFLGEVEVQFYKDNIWYYGCASQEIKLDPNTGVVTVLRTWSSTENDW